MGLIKAALGSIGGALADQWKDYFFCESMPADVIVTKGKKRESKRSSNTKGNPNIITGGSVIAVADGQCMIIVEQGKVAELCAEPGEYTFDSDTEPSIFYGSLSKSVPAVMANIGKRFAFGGEAPMDQRIYYFNTKELVGNKYGTPSPVPFRVVDANVGLDVDIAIRCSGEYSYRISNPILFYANVCGNVESAYTRGQIEGQLKSELLTALQPAFAKISTMGIRYSMLPGHTTELAEALNEALSDKWRNLRGVEIVSFGVSTIKASEEDEAMIKEIQRNAAFRNPTMAAAHLVGAQAAAMQSAASNKAAGPAMAFMGMNMAGAAGGAHAQGLFEMGQAQQAAGQAQQAAGQAQQATGQPAAQATQQAQHSAQSQQAARQTSQQSARQAQQVAQTQQSGEWSCACGAINSGKFCAECGAQRPAADTWTCACGAVNSGKFCAECGSPRPQAAEWKCACGAVNGGKFCAECGAKRP